MNVKGKRVKCPREACGAEWVARVACPVECVRCKQYVVIEEILGGSVISGSNADVESGVGSKLEVLLTRVEEY